MKAKNQIAKARALGVVGYHDGKKAPSQDQALLEMLRGRKVGETPEGEAPTKWILDAWNFAWHDAHNDATKVY